MKFTSLARETAVQDAKRDVKKALPVGLWVFLLPFIKMIVNLIMDGLERRVTESPMTMLAPEPV